MECSPSTLKFFKDLPKRIDELKMMVKKTDRRKKRRRRVDNARY